MQSKRIGQVVAAGALLFSAAACGGSGTAAGGSTGQPSGAAATVSVQKGVLVDRQGRALYESAQESDGKVRCTGSCAGVWKPLLVSGRPHGGSSAIGTLGTVTRPGGQHQVTDDGKPLYTFTMDSSPGQVTGDGAKDSFGGRDFVWHVVRPGGATAPSTGSGSGGGGGYNY